MTADPLHTIKDNKSRAPKLLSSGIESSGKGVIIVGGGSGAFYAVESLREVCVSSERCCTENQFVFVGSMDTKDRSPSSPKKLIYRSIGELFPQVL